MGPPGNLNSRRLEAATTKTITAALRCNSRRAPRCTRVPLQRLRSFKYGIHRRETPIARRRIVKIGKPCASLRSISGEMLGNYRAATPRRVDFTMAWTRRPRTEGDRIMDRWLWGALTVVLMTSAFAASESEATAQYYQPYYQSYQLNRLFYYPYYYFPHS